MPAFASGIRTWHRPGRGRAVGGDVGNLKRFSLSGSYFAARRKFAQSGRRWRYRMKQPGSMVRFGFAAAALLLSAGVAAPLYAQVSMSDPDAAVACGAFQRWGAGGWTALAPTTLAYDNGTVLNIGPGQSFAPSQ